MILRDRPDTDLAAGDRDAAPPDARAAALWSALSAERRARDERTARLRVMRLIAGEEAGAPV